MTAAAWGLASVALLTGAGCAAPVKDVSNPDPSGSIPAMELAAEKHDWRAVPQMVKDLESDDPAIRFYAIEGLRRITGQTFGFRYYEEERNASRRWTAGSSGWRASITDGGSLAFGYLVAHASRLYFRAERHSRGGCAAKVRSQSG